MMQIDLTLLIFFSGIFLLSLTVTYLVRRYALQHLLDIPNSRSSHIKPTPTGGGLGIVIAFVAALSGLYCTGRIPTDHLLALLSALLIAGIGFWDDHRHIAARWRFLVHFIAALVALYCLQGFPEIYLGSMKIDFSYSGYFFGALLLVWLLNLFNFMDGIDGIAAAEAIFVSAALAGFVYQSSPDASLVGFLLSISCLGFLLLNWPPAKIFMGDIGSGFLGFSLGLLILICSQHNPVLIYLGIILFAVFIVDATYTLLIRFVSGKKWYEAHCSHAYQILSRKQSHLSVVLALWVVNLFWLLPMAYLAYSYASYAWAVLVLAYLPLIGVAWRLAAGVE